jgi:hypothetical protein
MCIVTVTVTLSMLSDAPLTFTFLSASALPMVQRNLPLDDQRVTGRGALLREFGQVGVQPYGQFAHTMAWGMNPSFHHPAAIPSWYLHHPSSPLGMGALAYAHHPFTNIVGSYGYTASQMVGAADRYASPVLPNGEHIPLAMTPFGGITFSSPNPTTVPTFQRRNWWNAISTSNMQNPQDMRKDNFGQHAAPIGSRENLKAHNGGGRAGIFVPESQRPSHPVFIPKGLLDKGFGMPPLHINPDTPAAAKEHLSPYGMYLEKKWGGRHRYESIVDAPFGHSTDTYHGKEGGLFKDNPQLAEHLQKLYS